jgi:hypothetical protein
METENARAKKVSTLDINSFGLLSSYTVRLKEVKAVLYP